MKGMDGGGSTQRRLMIRLSDRVPVVMTMYRTTKACPVCRNYDLKMKYLEGNTRSYNKHLKKSALFLQFTLKIVI